MNEFMKSNRVKRIISIVIAYMLFFALIPMPVLTDKVKAEIYGDFEYYINDDGTVSICGYYGEDAVLKVPSEINGCEVTSVSFWDKGGNNTMVELIIPEGVTAIDDYAFNYCEALEKITLPESLKSIGYEAFRYTNLKEIVIPANVESIGDCCFEGGYSVNIIVDENNSNYSSKDGMLLNKEQTVLYCYPKAEGDVVIPDSVIEIAEYAFYKHENIEIVTIPSSVKIIGKQAFYNSSIKKAVLEGTEIISESAFESCENLCEVIFLEGVKFIGKRGFSGCSSLKEIVIPETVETIGDSSFSYCDALEDVTISEGVKSIGTDAFFNCVKLKEIVIPGSVESIGSSAFVSCKALEKVIFSEGVQTIGGSAFSGCSIKEVIIPESVQTIGKSAFSYCNDLENIMIYEGVQSIGEQAFYNCNKLEKVTIPSSVEQIGGGVFSSSYKGEIIVDEKNPYFTMKDGMLLSKEENVLYFYPVESGNLVIPDYIKEIADYTFYYDEEIDTVTIPSSVKYIGSRAFSSSSINELILEGDTILGDYAFYFCNNLAKINGTVRPSEYAFFYTEIEEVNLNQEITSIPCGAFSQCFNLKEIVIPDSVVTIERDAFSYCYSIENIVIPDGVIHADGFYGCTSLKKIVIPKSVTSLSWSNSENLTIYCYENSYGHNIAIWNNINYVLLDGEDSLPKLLEMDNSWTLGEETGLTIVSSGDFITFKSVKVDGEELASSNYIASECSTIIELTPEYLATLTNGKHIVTIVHINGEVTGEFEVIINISSAPETILGDVNGDGSVTAIDARLALQAAAGNHDLDETATLAADANGDGKVTSIDARLILQAAAGNYVL